MHKYITSFFDDCTFTEDTHTYSVGGKNLNLSVSGLLKHWTPKVDFDQKSYAMDRRKNLPHGTHKQLWRYKAEAACAVGTSSHFFAEVYAINKVIVPNTGFEVAAKAFIDNLPSHIEIVCTEYVMYHKKYLFGGMADLLLYNTKTKKYIIADYKTNENLHKCFNDTRLLAPFAHLQDSALGKYSLQLSTYRLMAEQTGASFDLGVIVWLKPNGTYEILPNMEQDMVEPLAKIYG